MEEARRCWVRDLTHISVGWIKKEESFLGVTADEGYGGLSMGYQAHCVVLEEISRASGTTLATASIHT